VISPVTTLKNAHDELKALLLDSEPSLAIAASESLSKSLLLSAASELETRLQDELVSFYSRVAGDHELAIAFVRNKAIARQYHTYFAWSGSNANTFFALFGPRFKNWAVSKITGDAALDQSVKAFLRLGSERNQLVHGNYVVFSMSLTAEEIHNLYLSASAFVDAIPILLAVELPEE
jgi:hypothetical protein